ncbi:MAG: DNA repair protein RadC [Litorivivens sp.]|jgi:DNA repair protein RadC
MKDLMSSPGGLKSWASEDRPREKMMSLGKSVLTDAELLAILIGSGTIEESAVDLARKVLAASNNNLGELSRKSVHDLMQHKGIGEARAISILAAMELAKRRQQSEPIQKKKITSSRDAYDLLYTKLADLSHEEFWVLLLSRSNKVIELKMISKGGITGTVVDVRLIFAQALAQKACGMILSHNHPSGNLKPSESDIRLTKKMSEAGKILDIPVLDHIIATDNAYFSFADESML